MNNKLLKINMLIAKYLLFAVPICTGTILWILSLLETGPGPVGALGVFLDILGIHFMIWFVFLIYFIFSLVFYSAFREKILSIVTFSKERDERESYISGKASKATFYSTLAILILFFFLSGLNVHIYKKPKGDVDGKSGTVTIGYAFEFLNSAEDKKVGEVTERSYLKFDGIPFTQECIILFLILYHVASYHIFSRKRLER